MKELLVFTSLAIVFAKGSAPIAATRTQAKDRSHGNAALPAADLLLEPFEIDVGSLRGKVATLRIDERREQIADWAVYGTLYQSGLPADAIRTAMYDKVPFRLPLLEEAARWDYGPGRRVLLPDGQVWLFHSEHDPFPDVTVARLADRVRMEIGQLPASVRVFSFESDLASGSIRVRHTRDVGKDQLFSPAFGYHAARVSSAAQLSAWLSRVDDLTHVRLLPDGAVELAGRQFDQLRTSPAGFSAVATLYRAQATIDDNHKAVEAYLKSVVSAFNALIHSYNASARSGGFILPTGSASSYAEIERLLDAAPITSGQRGLSADDLWDSLGLSPRPRPGLTRAFGGAMFGASEEQIESLRKRVEAFQLAVATREVAIPGAGKLLPEAPGFSLDPSWDVAGLKTDLGLVLYQPNTLLLRARALAKPVTSDDEIGSPSLEAAFGLNKSVPEGRTVTLPPAWRKRVERVIAVLPRTGTQLDKSVLLDLERLSEDTRNNDNPADESATELIQFALNSHRIQCARYDGPMQGTEVAMNLFYTDYLAKVLAGLDFHNKAPINEVLGFATVPQTAPDVEAEFWAEDLARPSTRLWFGPKAEGMTVSPSGDELNFDHIASRVYSAGSHPLFPGREQAASETTGRVLRWWDRHFDQIANYEQQYHLQNQIMKWSVVTGWLESKQRLRFLAAPAANGEAGREFDRWYRERTDLRYREALAVRPRSEWANGTECIDILRSRPYMSDGHFSVLSGGVSLGSKGTVESAIRLSDSLPAALRRGGLSGEIHAGSSHLKTTGGTTFDLPAGKPTSTISLADNQKPRGGGIELNAHRVETTIAAGHGEGSVAVNVGGHGLGQLKVRHTSSGVRLDWSDGIMMRAGKEASALARRAQYGGLTRNASELGLRPQAGSYFIRKADGTVQAVISSADSAKEPAVLLKVGSGEPSGKALLKASEGDWISGLFGLNKGGKPKVETAIAIEVPQQTGSRMVDNLPWQTLHLEESSKSSSAPTVTRAFTDAPPGMVTRRARLHTGDRRIPVVEASFTDSGVALRRPAGANARSAFNDLFTNLGLSHTDLRQMLDAAHAGQSDIYIGRASGSASPSPHPVPGPPAPGLVDPDVSIRAAFSKLRDRDLDQAISFATAAGKGPRGPPGSAAMARYEQAVESLPVSDGGDAKVLADYLRVQGSPDGYALLALDRRGHALHTVATIPEHRTPVSAAEVAKAIGDGDVQVVYAQDAPVLAHLDWDASPGETGAKVVANPSLRWEKIELPPALAGVEPTQLVSDRAHYLRREVTNRRVHGDADRRRNVAYIATQSCDTNGDGVVDAAEQAACP